MPYDDECYTYKFSIINDLKHFYDFQNEYGF